AFSQKDFSDLGSSSAVRKALSRLEQSGKLRRVIRGIYDFPKFSKLLDKQLSPDIDAVATAMARKSNWSISPTGDTALNLLGLSTQVPGRFVYLSNGPNRQYELGNQTLEFKKTTLKEVGFKHRESELLVQAIKTLGKEGVDDKVISKLRRKFAPDACKRILKDTKMTRVWVYAVIKNICQKVEQ
ncbi:MAG: hypothetical protein GY694_08270, partial [Gammaproteobacteria bacterium]|nr:hypothetical protein [Gammaproteobacteria bacterium]